MEDHRIIVGVGDTAALQLDSGTGNPLRAGGIGQDIHLARLADVPVLAELAGKIAPRRAEGEHRRTGQKVVERLLLDGIDTVTAGAAVGSELDAVFDIGAHETETALAFMELAVA